MCYTWCQHGVSATSVAAFSPPSPPCPLGQQMVGHQGQQRGGGQQGQQVRGEQENQRLVVQCILWEGNGNDVRE
jgi:hypothetical protein